MIATPDTRLDSLASRLTGDLHTGHLMRALYATDASEYQEMPLAVALPRSEGDVRELVRFAAQHRVGVIPRGAGTSLSGDCLKVLLPVAGSMLNAPESGPEML